LTIKVAKINDIEPVDPEETLKSIQQEANYSLLNNLMLNMCHKYNNTFIMVNIDNYNTSPVVLILLRNRGIYGIGTVKNPNNGAFTNCAREGRNQTITDGYVRMAVCEFGKIQAFGWNGNNQVHIFSTADAYMQQNHVFHQRVSAKLQERSPIVVPVYNHGMQGVDRHDQL
jgi:hypothetical protein